MWCAVDGHLIGEGPHQRDAASLLMRELYRNILAPTAVIVDGHGEGVGITVVGRADVDRSALRGVGVGEFGGVRNRLVYR